MIMYNYIFKKNNIDNIIKVDKFYSEPIGRLIVVIVNNKIKINGNSNSCFFVCRIGSTREGNILHEFSFSRVGIVFLYT